MNKRTISITREATCFMKPDICTISFTSNKYSTDYVECMNKLNDEVSKIISKLKRMKIDKESLTTKEKALRMAIEKDKKNADIIAMGLGVKLGNVLDVKYSFEELSIRRRQYDYLEDMQICESSCDFNIIIDGYF